MPDDVFGRLDNPFTGEELFDHLSNLVYFVKNRRGEYVVVNQTLVDRCGVKDKRALLGRTASEVLRPPLGRQFESQDQAVLRTGKPITSRLELHQYATRDIGWCVTTKLPLRGKGRRILGLVGVSQDIRAADTDSDAYRQMRDALRHAESRPHDPPTVEELASRSGMSRYQLDRRMRRVFSLSTRQWLVKLRIGVAERLLRDTAGPIAEVALAVGYADQSAFSRQFLKTTGLTPGAYRRIRSPDGDPK